MPVDRTWSAELDNLLLEALRTAWRSCNADFFHNALRPPVMFLDDTRARLGQWHRAHRTLSISRPLVRERSWRLVREVLKHEMAHQFVDEVLGKLDEPAHGPAFLRVCAERHIDARAFGIPEEPAEGPPTDEAARVIRRVQKLLALAESSNVHEAEAAANAAQRLMLEHNVAARGPRTYFTRAFSAPTTRLSTYERLLASLIARHFFVEIVFAFAYLPDLGRDGRLVEASGTVENLAMAEWVYGFLLQAGERACRQAVASGELVGRDRRKFLEGFMTGVDEKLARESKKNVEAGLVWIGDADLKEYVRTVHPRLYATSVRRGVDEAHARGRIAGNDVVISRPVTDAPTARGHLLGK